MIGFQCPGLRAGALKHPTHPDIFLVEGWNIRCLELEVVTFQYFNLISVLFWANIFLFNPYLGLTK